MPTGPTEKSGNLKAKLEQAENYYKSLQSGPLAYRATPKELRAANKQVRSLRAALEAQLKEENSNPIEMEN